MAIVSGPEPSSQTLRGTDLSLSFDPPNGLCTSFLGTRTGACFEVAGSDIGSLSASGLSTRASLLSSPGSGTLSSFSSRAKGFK